MEIFYSRWLVREQLLLNDLSSVPRDRPDLHIPLIARALSHYSEYYLRKSLLAEREIFQVLSPHWLTSFERSFLWLGGVQPCVIFRLIPTDLTIDQRRQVEELKQEADVVVRELNMTMWIVEEAMAVQMALTTVHGPYRNGDARGEATARAAQTMYVILSGADALRRRIVMRTLRILNTAQAVRFFAGAARLQLRVRWLGLHRNVGA